MVSYIDTMSALDRNRRSGGRAYQSHDRYGGSWIDELYAIATRGNCTCLYGSCPSASVTDIFAIIVKEYMYIYIYMIGIGNSCRPRAVQ